MSRNRLGDETSPYLLQHKGNPVHWWPWSEAALAEARKQQKPILLSVGYAACHWCHVMAHESFEDAETASVMNELFVNIKVDREERPDVDTIYMNALHALGEHGGWPLTMFLTPEAEPFWGGTYFPKLPRFGRPGFIEVMRQVSRVFAEEPEKVAGNAKALTAHLAPKPGAVGEGEITETLLADATQKIAGLTDPVGGGVKGAMKFPQSPLFAFLWRAGIRYRNADALDAVTRTLTHMCQGGIYDHLGGGFARYAVDSNWLVPHFEKMLYDNAQLIDLLSDVYAETRNPLFADRIHETIDWLKREMTVEGGGFASSLDADSEGEEGKFYVWTRHEITAALGGKEAAFFSQWYDVTGDGNWEGKTILNRSDRMERASEQDEKRLANARAKLLKARSARIRPGFDDKVLADWNGLTIAALAKAGFVFADDAWIDMAERAHQFICKSMTTDGRLSHSWREGQASAPATATDYAAMIRAALALYAATGVSDRLGEATGWVEALNRHYWSDDLAGYTLAAADTADIIVRPFSGHDDATPNANGMMVSNLMTLWLLTGDDPLRERAERIVSGFTGEIAKNLFAHTSLLSGVLDVVAPAHIVIAAPTGRDEASTLLNVLRKISVPGAAVQVFENMDAVADTSPARGKKAMAAKPTAYVCIGPVCAPPVTTPKSFSDTLEEWRSVRD